MTDCINDSIGDTEALEDAIHHTKKIRVSDIHDCIDTLSTVHDITNRDTTTANTTTANCDSNNDSNNNDNNSDGHKINKHETDKEIREKSIYEPKINDKNAAISLWNRYTKVAEVVQMRGNFWRVFGYSVDRKSFLFPEEALLLYERSSMTVEVIEYVTDTVIKDTSSSLSPAGAGVGVGNTLEVEFENLQEKKAVSTVTKIRKTRYPFQKFYEEVIGIISMPVYLAYTKLKSLDYIVLRHGKNIKAFEGDAQVYGTAMCHTISIHTVY